MSGWAKRDAALTIEQIEAELIVVTDRMRRSRASSDRWQRAHRRKVRLLGMLMDRQAAGATTHGGEQ